jgi:hypothetical protein
MRAAVATVQHGARLERKRKAAGRNKPEKEQS